MMDEQIRKDIGKVLEGFDQHIFVRNTDQDHEPGWAIRALPYLAALGRLVDLTGHESSR